MNALGRQLLDPQGQYLVKLLEGLPSHVLVENVEFYRGNFESVHRRGEIAVTRAGDRHLEAMCFKVWKNRQQRSLAAVEGTVFANDQNVRHSLDCL